MRDHNAFSYAPMSLAFIICIARSQLKHIRNLRSARTVGDVFQYVRNLSWNLCNARNGNSEMLPERFLIELRLFFMPFTIKKRGKQIEAIFDFFLFFCVEESGARVSTFASALFEAAKAPADTASARHMLRHRSYVSSQRNLL